MEYDQFSAMNTTILVAAEGTADSLRPGFETVRRYVAEAERRFSRFREDSELSLLNRASGQWFQASPELFGLVQEAQTWYRVTSGLFDPSLLPALRQIGYDRSLTDRRLRPAPAASPVTKWTRPRFEEMLVDLDRQRILLPRGVELDLGGIAKGWIAARATEMLGNFSGSCAVSAGGDMALRGLPEGQTAWQVSLEDPRDANRVAAVLSVRPGSLATSSVTKRRWIQGELPRHHILDPRSGLPAESEWLCVTVWTESATGAEAFAKALLIASSEEAAGLSGRVEGLRFIAVRRDGTLWGSSRSQEMLYVPT
jgi:thiamine biosynthesis lipoprotein